MSNSNWIERSIGHPDKFPGEWVKHELDLCGEKIIIALPREPDRLLDDLEVHKAQAANDYMPYWAYLWPSSFFLAEAVLKKSWSLPCTALELGCGLGLSGIAALKRGMRVTFSDYTEAALSLSSYNAQLNGFDDFEAVFLDWKNPGTGSFEVILGADVLYENRCREDILRVLDARLDPGGFALLGDALRPQADLFPQNARNRGYAVSEIPSESPHTKVKGRIFEVRKNHYKAA